MATALVAGLGFAVVEGLVVTGFFVWPMAVAAAKQVNINRLVLFIPLF